MTTQERDAVLELVAEAVVNCAQLRSDPRLTYGQLFNAAKQITAAVHRAMTKPERKSA